MDLGVLSQSGIPDVVHGDSLITALDDGPSLVLTGNSIKEKTSLSSLSVITIGPPRTKLLLLFMSLLDPVSEN